jgi:hypothetical protein
MDIANGIPTWRLGYRIKINFKKKKQFIER